MGQHSARGPAAEVELEPERPRRPRRTWGQRSVLLLSCSLVLGLLGSAGVLGYVYSKYSRLPRIELGGTLTERTGRHEPQNFLMVGVDSAANPAEDDPARQCRDPIRGLSPDTTQVLRIQPRPQQA